MVNILINVGMVTEKSIKSACCFAKNASCDPWVTETLQCFDQ